MARMEIETGHSLPNSPNRSRPDDLNGTGNNLPYRRKNALGASKEEGVKAVWSYGLCYFVAVLTFLASFNIRTLHELPYPLIGNLLPEDLWNYWGELVVFALLMWGFHYARRFCEVMFIHKYSRRSPMGECFGASLYYGFWGLAIGWSLNFHLGYRLPHPAIFYPGVFIFLVGEFGNFMAHWKLSKQSRVTQKDPLAPHVMPTGPLFRFVSLPHYLFEIVTWIGYALATCTFPACLFLFISALVLIIRAVQRHAEYKAQFREYPANRKAIIPFIL